MDDTVLLTALKSTLPASSPTRASTVCINHLDVADVVTVFRDANQWVKASLAVAQERVRG